MTTTAPKQHALYQYLQHNSSRHLIEISAEIHRRLVERAQSEGFAGLKLSFGKIISFVQYNGARISDIAETTGISKQALGILANEIEKEGFISRHADPLDARSKQLRLTERGQQLIDFCASVSGEIEANIANHTGKKALRELKHQIDELSKNLPLPKAFRSQIEQSPPELRFTMQLSSLAHYCEQELLTLSHRQGYRNTKLSHGQILRFIDNSAGMTVNDLARLNGISKQAVSKTVSELESLGYLWRVDNPNDKRSKSLTLTEQGIQLMLDAKASIDNIDAQFSEMLGDERCAALLQGLQNAYIGLGLDNHNTNRHLDQLLQKSIDQLWHKSTPQEQALLFELNNEQHPQLTAAALQRLKRLTPSSQL